MAYDNFKSHKIKLTTPAVNLDFFIEIILLCFFFFFFLILDLYFSIPAVVTQICNPVAELVIPIGIPTKEAKPEKRTHPVTLDINLVSFIKIFWFLKT